MNKITFVGLVLAAFWIGAMFGYAFAVHMQDRSAEYELRAGVADCRSDVVKLLVRCSYCEQRVDFLPSINPVPKPWSDESEEDILNRYNKKRGRR